MNRGNARFIGLDLGSTAIKGVAVSGDGELLGSGSIQIERLPSPDPTVFEIDPEAFIDSVVTLIAKLSPEPRRTEGISWVAASGNILLLDAENHPIAPMVSWLDERPLDGSIAEEIAGTNAEALYESVGWPLSPQFPYGRLIWLRKNQPDLMARTRRICTGNDWLGYRLTGNWAIDRSTATTMYVYEQEKARKHAGNLARLGLDSGLFSELRETGSFLGLVRPEIRARMRMGAETGAWLGSFDHPGAARALGIWRNDQLLVSCGTSWVGLVALPDRKTGIRLNMLVDPYESGSGGTWCGMFSLMAIGKLVDAWLDAIYVFHRGMVPGDRLPAGNERKAKFEAVDRLVAAADPTGKVPLFDLRSMKSDAGTIGALYTVHGAGALFRGVMESSAFEFRRLLGEKMPDPASLREIFMVGGPASSTPWRQILADTLDRTVLVRFASNAGAVGAALTAARQAGFPISMREKAVEVAPREYAVKALNERYQRFLGLRSERK